MKISPLLTVGLLVGITLVPSDHLFAPKSAAAEQNPGGRGGQPGVVKPSLADTLRLSVYADNWFALYINGKLTAVDSIDFIPHNVVSVDVLPQFPMTIAVLAKDNADPGTGLEYGSQIGDGGFILKLGNDIVSSARWKAKCFFRGPLNRDPKTKRVEREAIPAGWWATDFNDSDWGMAREFTIEQVGPKQPYFNTDFEGARFIWTEDLALDNTVIFRARIERPGWQARWNTRPDLDILSAPVK